MRSGNSVVLWMSNHGHAMWGIVGCGVITTMHAHAHAQEYLSRVLMLCRGLDPGENSVPMEENQHR